MKAEKLGYIISIEDYQGDRLPKVGFAKNDAIAIQKIFKKTFGLEDHEIKMFINSDVTHATFENEIAYELKNLSPETEFYFYYAGHGYHDGSQNWLTCWDTHINSLEATAIPLHEKILLPVSKSNCKSALLFLDTCSKQMMDTVKSRAAIQNFKLDVFSDFVNKEKYRAIFTSCSQGESAYPSREFQHGIWTSFLLKALNGESQEPLNENLEITGQSLQNYLSASVKKYIREKTEYKQQNPHATISAADVFIIAKFKAKDLSLPDTMKTLDPDIQKQFFRSETTIAFVKHHNYKKRGRNFEPENINSHAAKWASELTAEEVKQEIKDVYENCVSNLGLKRSNLKKGDSTLDCDLFRYSIESTQDPKDYTKILITRKIRLTDAYQYLPLEFDDTFPIKPDELVIPFKNHPKHEDLLKIFEDLEQKTEGSISEDDDEGFLQIVTPDGLSFKIDTDRQEIIFSSKGTKGIISLMPSINSKISVLGFSSSLPGTSKTLNQNTSANNQPPGPTSENGMKKGNK